MTTTTTIVPNHAVSPQRAAPSWGWAIRRAILGLAIMFAMTGVAAYLAHASIEPANEPAPGLSIGAPAAPLVHTE